MGFICVTPIALSQEGYRNISMGFGSSVSSFNHRILSLSYEALLPNGDAWEYGLDWFRKSDLNLTDSRISSKFDYEGALDIALDSKDKTLQSWTMNAHYNRKFYQWKNVCLLSHFGMGIGVSNYRLSMDGVPLAFSSFQWGPHMGTSYQQFLSNRLSVFIRLSVGVYWRVQLPPFYPSWLQFGFKIPI